MDFNLPEELQLLKDPVRKFVDRELIPLERECRPEGEDMPEQLPLFCRKKKPPPEKCGCTLRRR